MVIKMFSIIQLSFLSLISINSVLSGAVPSENKCPGTLYEVRITDCTAFPCKIYKVKEYKVEIDFTPTKNTSAVSVRCNTVYYGQSYQIPEEKMCKDIIPEGCPLNNYTKYTYTVKFTVVYFVPSGTYPIRCIVIDDTRSEQLCLSATGIIV